MNTKVRYAVLLTLILFMSFVALRASIVSTESFDQYVASTEPALQFFSSAPPSLRNPNTSHEKCNVFSCKDPEYIFDYGKWKKAQEAILKAQMKRLDSIKNKSNSKSQAKSQSNSKSQSKKLVCPPQISVEDIQYETPEEAELNAEKDALENSILETQDRLNDLEAEFDERKQGIESEIVSLLMKRDQVRESDA